MWSGCGVIVRPSAWRKDPYSSSKGMAELAIRSFVCSYLNEVDPLIKVGIARAGNVIGGGDWAADRVVPDCVRAWSIGEPASIRNPNSTRPWQHVLEPLSGYLVLASNLAASAINHGEAYNLVHRPTVIIRYKI